MGLGRWGVVFLCASAFARQPFKFEDLKKLIETNDLRSVEAVLPHLPLPLRSHFTLMKNSVSQQESDPLHPRAILYGDDARFIVTFGGHPAYESFQTLETAEFVEPRKEVELREIVFSAGNPARFSEINPHQCTTCHRTPARYVWPEYLTWERAYGEDDDKIQSGSGEYESLRPPQPQSQAGAKSPAYLALGLNFR
ncbi:MAG: hypothetical protein HYR96_10665 [Deltaproteobacteria bacterium]|nr:hypothetical protein [Deltaproteobacteria bacterium]MBI3294904.1 hypothetical protein [Deltaproteobacteria bacterium]